MNRNIVAIAIIAIIVVAGIGVFIFLQPVPNPYSVAIVFATGGLGDKSFNDGCYKGASDAADDFDIEFTYVEPQEIAEYEGYIRQYAAHTGYIEPYDLIICIGFDQLFPLMDVAEEYPNQQFAIVDEALDNTSTTEVEYENVLGLKFAEHEGSALVGAMAGMMSVTNKLGFVGGMDIPLINKFAGGFQWGANYSHPGTNLTISYTNNFGDPTTGKTAADTLYDLGCDIVFGAAGASGLGVFTSVKEKNETITDTALWCIGVDSPQMYLGTEDPENPEGPSLCITSMLKKVDLAVYEAIEAAVTDDFEGGIQLFDIENGGIDYEVNSTLLEIDDDILDFVDDLKEAIANGTIDASQFDHKYWLDEA